MTPTTIQFHLGLAYKLGEGYPFPEKPVKSEYRDKPIGYEKALTKYKEALTEALRHAAVFTKGSKEYEALIYALPSSAFPSMGTVVESGQFKGRYNVPDQKLKDGSYQVDLPEHKRVEQERVAFDPHPWYDIPKSWTKKVSGTHEYHTVIRFVKESEPKQDEGAIAYADAIADRRKELRLNDYDQELLSNLSERDSAPIADQPKEVPENIKAIIAKYPFGLSVLPLVIECVKEIISAPDAGQGKQAEKKIGDMDEKERVEYFEAHLSPLIRYGYNTALMDIQDFLIEHDLVETGALIVDEIRKRMEAKKQVDWDKLKIEVEKSQPSTVAPESVNKETLKEVYDLIFTDEGHPDGQPTVFPDNIDFGTIKTKLQQLLAEPVSPSEEPWEEFFEILLRNDEEDQPSVSDIEEAKSKFILTRRTKP